MEKTQFGEKQLRFFISEEKQIQNGRPISEHLAAGYISWAIVSKNLTTATIKAYLAVFINTEKFNLWFLLPFYCRKSDTRIGKLTVVFVHSKER
jgi:hypothetical protein